MKIPSLGGYDYESEQVSMGSFPISVHIKSNNRYSEFFYG